MEKINFKFCNSNDASVEPVVKRLEDDVQQLQNDTFKIEELDQTEIVQELKNGTEQLEEEIETIEDQIAMLSLNFSDRINEVLELKKGFDGTINQVEANLFNIGNNTEDIKSNSEDIKSLNLRDG